jgi:hypothetical protein
MQSMNPRFPRIGLLIAATVVLLAAVVVVLNRRSANAEKAEVARIGADWEQSGRLSQASYVHLRQIISGVRNSGGVISDQDLDWSLAVMNSGSDAIVRARVMGMLGMLGERKPLPTTQKQKVLAAITPLLNSRQELDRRYAARVQKALESR